MNFQSQSNIEQQSETITSNLSYSQITPISKTPIDEPIFHSSQIKRPIIHFDEVSPNISDLNNAQNVKQSFNSMDNQNLKNIDSSISYSKKSLNFLNVNKSIQQEKYDSIKNFCFKKNDPDNFPLISYENFLLIDGLFESNSPEYTPYKNFLLNKTVSIELFSKFCTLLMNRFLYSKQNKSLKKYPKVVYQIIFDVNNIYNYLSPDIVADAKQSNMFMTLIFYEKKWNVLAINQNSNYCNYFMLNKIMDKKIILVLMNAITQTIYPNKKFQFTVSDYSGYNDHSQTILPFIIMDFLSRYKINLPIDDEDYYYQTILILSEIINNNLITK